MKIFRDYLIGNNNTNDYINKELDIDNFNQENLTASNKSVFNDSEKINLNNIYKDNLEEYEKLREYEKRRAIISLEL